MTPLPTILIGVALILLAAAPAAGVVVMPCMGLPGEDVTILNAGTDSVDVTGWTITDGGTTNTYTFPNFTLASGEMVTVHAGRGTNSATKLYWGLGPDHDPVWNDDGDTVTLWNTAGVRIADSRGYILGAPTPVTTMPLVTIPGYSPVSPIPTPYVTTSPTGVASHAPIASPYPTTLRTLSPGEGPTTVSTTLPIPREQPQWVIPTRSLPAVLPTVATVSPIGISRSVAPGMASSTGWKRFAIGTPGTSGTSMSGRFGSRNVTAVTGGPRMVPARGPVLGPGTDPHGITPTARGSFVRWYPAAQWAAELR